MNSNLKNIKLDYNIFTDSYASVEQQILRNYLSTLYTILFDKLFS